MKWLERGRALAASVMELLRPRPDDDPATRLRRATWHLLAIAGVTLNLYVLGAIGFLLLPDFPTTGPGDPGQATLMAEQLPPAILAATRAAAPRDDRLMVRAAYLPDASGGSLWIVYLLRDDGGVTAAVAFDDATGARVREASRLKPTGAWRYLGWFRSPENWFLGGLFFAGSCFAIYRWAPGSIPRGRRAHWDRRQRKGHPVGAVLACLTVIGVFWIWWAPGWNRELKWVWQYRWLAAVSAMILLMFLYNVRDSGDGAVFFATATIMGGAIGAWLVGWFSLRPAGLAVAEEVAAPGGYGRPSAST